MDENAFGMVRAEWARVCERPGSVEAVRGWLVEAGLRVPVGPECGLDDLLQGLKRGGGQAFSDQWLSVLVQRVLDGSELAALMVVQAMSPSALKTVRRLCAQYADASLDDVAQVVLSSLYEVVRRYPLTRRPAKIALNISMDAHHLASRELAKFALSTSMDAHHLASRELRRAEAPLAAPADVSDVQWVLADRDGDHPVAAAEQAQLAATAVEAGLGDVGGDLSGARGELVELLVWALRERVLGRESARALTDHYRDGSLGDVAAARAAGVSAAAWRQRRSRAVRQLRDAAPLWLAQAA